MHSAFAGKGSAQDRNTRRKPHKVGCFSRPHVVARADRRTRDGRLVKAIEAELIAHVGGPDKITAPQKMLASTAALLALRLALTSERFGQEGEDVLSLDRHIATLSNSLLRLLSALGLERPEQAPKRLADILSLNTRPAA